MITITMDTIEKERKARLQDVLEISWSGVEPHKNYALRKELESLTRLIEKSKELYISDLWLTDLISRRVVLRERIGE